MALSYIGVSAAPIFGTTTATATYPSGYTATAGDRAYLLCVHKRPAVTPATPANWNLLGTVQVGTGTAGAAAGPLRLTIFWRDLTGGDTIPAVTISGTGAVIGVACAVYRKGATETFDHAIASMTDTGSSTTFSGDYDVNPGLTAGDQILCFAGLTISTTTAGTWSFDIVTGATVSALTEHHDHATTNGDDLRYVLNSGSITAGTCTIAPHSTCTTSGANTGGAYLLRVRATAATTAVIRSSAAAGKAQAVPSVTVTKPAGLAVGDYLLALHAGDANSDNTALMTAPAGFVSLGAQNGHVTSNYPALKIWGKVAASGDVAASNFAFTNDTDSGATVILIAIQAGTYNPADPVDLSSFTIQPRTATALQTAPSITATANDVLVSVFATDTNASTQSYPTSGPAGMTRIQTAQSAGLYSLLGAYSATVGAGATGTKTVTPTGAGSQNGWTTISLLLNGAAAVGAISGQASLAATATITAGGTVPTLLPEFVAYYEHNIGSTTTTTTAAFTPEAGEVILVKCSNGTVDTPNVDTVSGGGLTYNLIHTEGSGSSPEVWVYAAQVPDPSPGSMTVSATWTGSTGRHGIIVERYRNVQMPTAVGNSPRQGTGAPSASITTTVDNSLISWINTDTFAVSMTPTYIAGSVQIVQVTHAQLVSYSAYRPTTTAGAYTIGQTAPTDQIWTLLAVELKPIGVAAPSVASLAATATITAGGTVTPPSGGGTATFGQTVTSGSETSSSADRKKVSAASPSSSGTAESITITARVTAENTVIKGVIYADSGGAPGALLAVSDEITINSTTKQAWTANFSGANRISVTNGTTYWVGFFNKDPGTGGFAISRAGTSSASATNTNTYTSGPTDPFGTPTLESGPIDAYVTYSLPGGATVTGDATLASTATIGAAGYIERPSGATVAAAASITAAGYVTETSGAALALTAGLTAAGYVARPSGATLASTATITAAGYLAAASGAALAASASLTAAGYVVRPSDASLATTATITALGYVTMPSGAVLAGTASITAAGYVAVASGAVLAATATLTAAGVTAALVTSGAVLASTATIEAAGYRTAFGVAIALGASATITAAGYVDMPSGAVLVATATLTTAGVRTAFGAAVAVAGSAIITAAGVREAPGAAALMLTSSVLAAGYVAMPSGATLAGSVSITAAGFAAVARAAAVAAVASLTAAGAGASPGGAVLDATATLTAAGYVLRLSGATLAGLATITAAGFPTFLGAVSLAATTSITAAGFYVRPGGASLAGTATITAAAVGEQPAAVLLGSTATITTAGILALPAPVAVVSTASIIAAGALTLPAAAAVAVTAVLTAAGAGAAPGGAVLALSASLTAAGIFAGISGAALPASASITTTAGEVERPSGAVLDTSVTLTTSAFVDRLAAATVTALASVIAAGEGAAPGGASLALSAALNAAGYLLVPSPAALAITGAISTAGLVTALSGAALGISAVVTTEAATAGIAVMAITAAITAAGLWTRVSPAALVISAAVVTAEHVARYLAAELALSATVLAGPQLFGRSAAFLDIAAEIIATAAVIPSTTRGSMTAPVRPAPRIDGLATVTASISGLTREAPRMASAPNGGRVRMDGATAHKPTISRGQ